jgi:endonuclease YncB( thermonuclease family)
LRPRSWAVAFLAAGVLVLGVLQARFDMLSTLTHRGCRTTLCCEDCPSIRVSRVIDGDTLDSPAGRVRLFGVDTPERGERCYAQATELLRKLAGSSVRVEVGPRETDPNGRLLFYAYTRHGESIEERLIREGLGQAWTQDGQHRDLLVELEKQAQTSGSGCLW